MRATLTAVMLALVVGCGDDSPGTNQNTNQGACPEGHRADGPACAPVFDDPDACGAPNEMPVLGGGCRAVGVTQCATGFVSDGEGGCDPILPPDACPPGTMERLGETECQPVGVTQCATGFVSDGEGGCDAILPAEACPPGTLEVIGLDTCQPLGDCGPEGSRWGLIEADGTTVYVDASADGTGADGSMAAPFPTIGAALAVVAPGGQVAIAGGEYVESVIVDRPVRLVGRCPGRVTLRGADTGAPLGLLAGATGSAIRGVTLTGLGEGLQVTGATGVTVEGVDVRETGSFGVALRDAAEVTLIRVKVWSGTTVGIRSENSTLALLETVTQDTRPRPGDGAFGTGVQATCNDAARCGSLRLTSSLVTGNRYVGVFTKGVDTTVRASVVRDTRSQESDGNFGFGVAGWCEPTTGVCARLLVEHSLVAANRFVGVISSGVVTGIRDSVVRDTWPREVDSGAGTGIEVSCDAVLGICGSLSVTGSLVAANRQFGLYALGAEAVVHATIVRDTREHPIDQELGIGIGSDCDPAGLGCGSLRVDGSLVTRNRYAGIRTLGSTAAVHASVVSGTLPQASDQDYGRGIEASCWDGDCGELIVDGCLVDGNQDVGVIAHGVTATVHASVVRDTVPNPARPDLGNGIATRCEPGACGELLVEGCLVAGNRNGGIRTSGPATTVRATVVRDTLPEAVTLQRGHGIHAWCEAGPCDPLLVDGCQVTRNHELGILVSGVAATVRDTIVRDTRPRAADLDYGDGIGGWCVPETGGCGSLAVDGCLVVDNREAGIITFGVPLSIAGSVVRDTRPRESDGQFGRGIVAQCQEDVCADLSVDASLVSRSVNLGVYVVGPSVRLTSVAVTETEEDASGRELGTWGEGIRVGCNGDQCGRAELTDCLVRRNRVAGLVVEGTSGFVSRSLVETVLAQPGAGLYGYGIQIAGVSGQAPPTFDVRACRIRDARLAGVIYVRALGRMEATRVTGGEYCVALNEGSAATIDDSNHLACDVHSDPEWVNLEPAPAPPPIAPSPL
jgi:hypothetical protein